MNRLVGDIGNTCTKICILNNNFKIINKVILTTAEAKNLNFIKKK